MYYMWHNDVQQYKNCSVILYLVNCQAGTAMVAMDITNITSAPGW